MEPKTTEQPVVRDALYTTVFQTVLACIQMGAMEPCHGPEDAQELVDEVYRRVSERQFGAFALTA
jgi:hypothetical protein